MFSIPSLFPQVQTDLGDFSTFSLKIFERCSASTVRNMGPKQAAAEKRTKEKITIEMKEIIRKHDDGMRVTDLAREYGRNPSTIGTILKMREKILAMDAAKGVTRIMPNRPAVLEEVEKLLLIWMQEKQHAGDTVTEAVICEKAKALHADLIQQQAGPSDAEPEVFKASRGWFERFKTRSGVHSVVRHGEAASSHVPAAEKFASEFLQVVAEVEEHMSSTELKDICRQWESVQRFARQHHPDKILARDLANTLDTRVMSSFRGMLERRQKQQSMDRFITKKPRVEEEPAAPEASQPETVAACSSAPSTSSTS
ncbi:tigger transposable element-derived protein 1-like [Zootoca vivipara]|uniref:tigger transposable element-derived protein 1-like n=1 Tax=Zootoca vivipara TaxID=8524 RepID=UPI00293BBF3C|nr:tigger transposable element-derived protein 1-like [Zootoca vivipara]